MVEPLYRVTYLAGVKELPRIFYKISFKVERIKSSRWKPYRVMMFRTPFVHGKKMEDGVRIILDLGEFYTRRGAIKMARKNWANNETAKLMAFGLVKQN